MKKNSSRITALLLAVAMVLQYCIVSPLQVLALDTIVDEPGEELLLQEEKSAKKSLMKLRKEK